MLKSSMAFLSTLCALTLCHAEERMVAQQQQTDNSRTSEKCCGLGPRRMRADVRYTSPTGIGYNTGYTTLEAFFAPQTETWVPFVDLRAHLFDNGKFASNAGLGLRYLGQSRVWGGNLYYDYRNTRHQHFNQIAAGVENLGKVWDFRINGYLPLGKTESPFFNTRFAAFKAHHLFLSRSRDFALKGFNAEAGMHVDHFEKAPLYFAAGPYYLHGTGATTWGGELRAAVELFNRHLRIEGNTAYDHFFKWTGQGQISLNLFFGGKKNVMKKCYPSCCDAMTLENLAVQRVDRFEIIPVGREKKTSVAINPTTGLPWFFWFVNNTSSSDGTFESPYHDFATVQAASSPNQAIYVYPGDGTTRGMDHGITLKDDQLFLGASIKQSVKTTAGTVHIPSMASQMPNITNTAGNVVTLGNNNVVSGFSITTDHGNGITGNGISNLTVNQTNFLTSTVNHNGINLLNPTGQVIVSNSSFDGFSFTNVFTSGNGIFIYMFTGKTLDNVSITGSNFSHIGGNSGGRGIQVLADNGNFSNVNIANCTFDQLNGGYGILAVGHTVGLVHNVNIANCGFTHLSNNAAGIIVLGDETTSNISGCSFNNLNHSMGIEIANGSAIPYISSTIAECSFNNLSNSSTAIFVEANHGTIIDSRIDNCSFNNISNRGIFIVSTGNSTMTNSTVTGCTFTNVGTEPLTALTFTNSVITNLNILSNVFNDITTSGVVVQSSAPSEITNVNISQNTFMGNASLSDGYGAVLLNGSGSTCWNFTYNTATPMSAPIPYQFIQTGGTFNRTFGSDSSTNVGNISTIGTVNPPGSCSQ